MMKEMLSIIFEKIDIMMNQSLQLTNQVLSSKDKR